MQTDPDCLNNLIDDPAQQQELIRLRGILEKWMVDTGDHLLEVFQKRDDREVSEAYVQAKEAEADARRKKKRESQRSKQTPRRKQRNDLIALEIPKDVSAGGTVTVQIRHKIEAELGEQLIHVTLKGGKDAKRIERQVLKANAEGVIDVTFKLPGDVADNVISFAAFIGKDYQNNLQHMHTKPIPVR